ncbi:MAG TPA: GNAT family N-acetyltransferase [Thermoleophilaceae bacterium]|jgi:GNAT superfamily N-acetyltransferase
MEDLDAIEALMAESIRAHFPAFYAEERVETAVRYIGKPDRMLVEDGTYFVAEDETGLVACGGWSRRYRLYAGSGGDAEDARLLDPASEPAPVRAMFVRGDRSRRGLGSRILELCEEAARAEGFTELTLMATLPGVPLYERHGFRRVQELDIPLEDGTLMEGVRMERAIVV